MQQLAHVIIKNEKIKVLTRQRNNNSCSYRIRKTGHEGNFLKAESEYLSEHPKMIETLKKGKVIIL